MISDSLKDEIIKKVSPKKLHKLILFGSYAYGDPSEASDIDLLVVLNSDEMPRNYREKSSNYLMINRLLRDINKKVSMDLMVMTKAQWEKFIELDSGFSKEINLKGIHLIWNLLFVEEAKDFVKFATSLYRLVLKNWAIERGSISW